MHFCPWNFMGGFVAGAIFLFFFTMWARPKWAAEIIKEQKAFRRSPAGAMERDLSEEARLGRSRNISSVKKADKPINLKGMV